VSDWQLQDGSKSKAVTEAHLRKKLGSGDLSGIELVRAPGSSAWIPLYDTPLFAEVVPFVGHPARAAQWRLVNGFAWHLVSFLAVMFFLGFPSWGVFWGLGLLGHAVATLRPAVQLARGAAGELTSEAADGVEQVGDSPPISDFESDLAQVLAELSALEEPTDELRERALALHAKRRRLDAAVEGEDIEALRAERAQADQRAAQAQPADRRVYEAQAKAVADRMAVTEQAIRARDRLLAQEREVLHSLRGLALARLSSSSRVEASSDAGDRLERVRRSLDADAEVDDALARARRASRERL
jgi:hypothetical protein